MRDEERRYGGLDGLRGIAVVAVVGFHLWPGALPGGWLGVSLFFTLSGFLIVGQVDRWLSAQPASSARAGPRVRAYTRDFYGRRARRLLPALGVTLAGVMVAVWATRPEALDDVRGDVIAAVAYVANWRQAAAPGGYEAIFDTSPRPLAHLWSLAIEEQVYLIVPALLVITRRPVASVVGLAALGGAGLWFWWGDPDLYFATPVRGLEVLAGAGLALWLNRTVRSSLPGRAMIAGQVAGLAAMAALVVSTPDTDVTSRPWLLPVIAAGVWCPLVLSGLGDRGPLARGPLKWLGERSYAIYLFHWPLIALTAWSAPTIIAVTLAGAAVSYRLIEVPIRNGAVVRDAPLVRLVGATAVIALVAVLVPGPAGAVGPISAAEALAVARVVDEPVPAPARGLARPASPDETAVAASSRETEAAATESLASLPYLTGGRTEPEVAPRTVLLAGDSTAMRIEAPLRVWAEENGIVLTSRAVPVCSPVARSWEVRLGFEHWPLVERNDCLPTPDDMAVDAVVLIHHGVLTFQHRRPGEEWVSLTSSGALRADVAAAYAALADSTDARMLISSVPEIDLDAATVDDAAAPVASRLIGGLAAGRPDVEFLDATVVALDAERFARSDGIHLDEIGAAAFVLDVIAPALLPAG